MWPVVLGKLVAGAALAVGGLLLWQKYQQEQERQQVYWEPFEAQRPPSENSANERCARLCCSRPRKQSYATRLILTPLLYIQDKGRAVEDRAPEAARHHEYGTWPGAQVCLLVQPHILLKLQHISQSESLSQAPSQDPHIHLSADRDPRA